MTVLKRIHEYTINSDIIEKCPHKTMKYNLIIIFILSCAMLITFIRNPHDIIHSSIVFTSSLTIYLIYGTIQYCLLNCGIKIFLQKNNSYIIDHEYYQFTDNTQYDAVKIKNIIYTFEQKAIKLYQNNTSEKTIKMELKQKCCDQYKDRLTLIKTGDES